MFCRLWYYYDYFYVLHSIFSFDSNLISILNVNKFSNNNNNNELFIEQYLLIIMTVCIQKRDRCRICFSLILRDRSTLFSSICCQKYYHLFKHIQRNKIPITNKYNPYKIKISNRTVCFQELILRYLHTQIDEKQNFSNFICYDCSKILLDIEQCAKYLTKTINQLKIKFNKSNRLFTSSLSTTYQKKKQFNKLMKHEQLPIINSDEDEEFDDIEDDDEVCLTKITMFNRK